MASEPIEYQALVLRVSIHCQGCKKKVKKVLQSVNGVYRCDIDARSNKVTVTASKLVDASVLVAKLRKSGKQAEPWPEEPKQQQQEQPAESQSQETKSKSDEPSKTNEAAEKPGPENDKGSVAEPTNLEPSPEPKKSTDDTPKPAQESQETSNANTSGKTTDETKAAIGQQSSEPKGKSKQYQEEKPIDAKVTLEYGRGSYANHMPGPQPVHVMSYNVARPMASASYYAAAPVPAPTPTPTPMQMPMARPGPSQGYIDEQYSPPYYNRSSSYEPYYYPQPSSYRYQHYQQPSTDDYYYGASQRSAFSPPRDAYGVPQRSAFSPPRDAYGDAFNDENANSCSVM